MNLKARAVFYFIFLMLFPFIWLLWVFPAACGLSLVVECGLLFFAVLRLLIVVASCRRAWALGEQASVAVVHRLSCPMAYRTLQEQGSNPYPMHWQVDS